MFEVSNCWQHKKGIGILGQSILIRVLSQSQAQFLSKEQFKKFGRESTQFCKIKPFLEQICTIYMRFLCLNFTHWQNHQHLFSKNIPIANFGNFWCQNGRNLGAFIRVKFGLKVLLRVKGLTFCNSVLQTQVKKPKTQLKSRLVGIMIEGSLNVRGLKPSHDYPCWSLHFTSCWLFSLFKFQGRC